MIPAPSPSPKRRGRIGRIDVPSPRRVAAAGLVNELRVFHQVIEDVERRTIPLTFWNGKREAVERIAANSPPSCARRPDE
jgi:hypothetical protein